jgi:prepilin-type N-terminal cleavage/methylation domain-containing protein
MPIIHKKQNTGFTLIELLVSIALFSVVLTATLGSIMTIVDSNRKARSLMSVTNNLNFAVDAMVRSFKTGVASASFTYTVGNKKCFGTQEIDYAKDIDFTPRSVEYCWEEVGDIGKITKDSGSGAVDLTASDVDIDYADFVDTSFGNQPMLMIVLRGTVRVSPKISSEFSIQTSVSQRKLIIPN